MPFTVHQSTLLHTRSKHSRLHEFTARTTNNTISREQPSQSSWNVGMPQVSFINNTKSTSIQDDPAWRAADFAGGRSPRSLSPAPGYVSGNQGRVDSASALLSLTERRDKSGKGGKMRSDRLGSARRGKGRGRKPLARRKLVKGVKSQLSNIHSELARIGDRLPFSTGGTLSVSLIVVCRLGLMAFLFCQLSSLMYPACISLFRQCFSS